MTAQTGWDVSWDTADVRSRVDDRISLFLAGQRPLLGQIGPDVADLVDDVAAFMSGGKRLRALFCYSGWRAAGGPDGDPIIGAAAAMEFLQACALVHDDVMDRSESRRGRPAMHRQFATRHAAAGWAGGADDFGAAAAILVGDLCLSWADELLLGSGLTATSVAAGKPVYDVLRTELMAGQFLDILEQARRNTDVEPALQVARYKSAKYTIERPLHLGAAMAGGSDELIAALRRYGLALGIAFQLRDDLLGVYGDPGTTGKPSGDDLREGKRTVLVALALADLSPGDRGELAAGLDAADPAIVDRLRALVDSTRARARVEAMIDDYASQARDALTAAPDIDPTTAAVLESLVDTATRRIS